ncbi:MAG: glycosyltransferase [Victivallales bacterium]|nr:glycosyltransferase [Victivallales bacterium]
MTPLFSIVIPVYNVEAYLRKCLDSVLNQSFQNWECICVDDGSPDNCGRILDEYLDRQKALEGASCRLRVIHQANGGVSAARNAALEVATGEWVQFLDSDDSLKLDFLENLASDIQAHPDVDAIEHSAIYCYDDGRQVIGTSDGRLPPEAVITSEEVLADPYGRKYTNLARCSCYKIFKRSVIEQAGLRFTCGIPIGEDELFATQFYAYAGKVAICPKTAGYLRIFRSGSALLSISTKKLLPRIKIAEVLYATWKKRPSRGMTTRLAANLVMLAHLGGNYDRATRAECIEALLDSTFFNRTGIPFVLKHGTWKARLFAATYLLSPKSLRRKLLLQRAQGK